MPGNLWGIEAHDPHEMNRAGTINFVCFWASQGPGAVVELRGDKQAMLMGPPQAVATVAMPFLAGSWRTMAFRAAGWAATSLRESIIVELLLMLMNCC